MKTPFRILSVLLCYVLMQVQTWALSGGPDYQGEVTIVTGTFSGVLLPVLDQNAVAAAGGAAGVGIVVLDANALGLFSIGVPDVGFATGACAFFNRGEVFTGVMAGVADPDEGTITALMEASSIRVISIQVPGGAGAALTGTDVRTVGRMDAEVRPARGRGALARLEGQAVLSSFSDLNRNPDGSPILSNTIVFEVDGFKQSQDSTPPGGVDFGIDIQR